MVVPPGMARTEREEKANAQSATSRALRHRGGRARAPYSSRRDAGCTARPCPMPMARCAMANRTLPLEWREHDERRRARRRASVGILSRNAQLATPYTVLHKACITVHHTDKGAAPDVQTRHTVLRIRQGRSGHQHTQETSQTLAVAPPPPQPSGARRAHASSFSTTPNSRGRSQCDQSSLQCVPKSEGMVRAAAERAG